MKSNFMLLLFLGHTFAQENLSYQKPSKSILDLVDYERPPSVSMDTRNTCCSRTEILIKL
jgi:hypothetical protein